MAKHSDFGWIERRNCRTLVLSLPTEYEFKSLFIALIISVVAISLVVNPILLDRYMKKSKLGQEKNVNTLGGS